MPQRTIIADANDIRTIAGEINVFSCRKQIFKVQILQFSTHENQVVEKAVVRYYSLRQHSFGNTLPGYTLIIYLVLILANIVPAATIGIVPTIFLYIPFTVVSFFLLRILIAWYAKRGLMRLANDLESQHHNYSFVLNRQQKNNGFTITAPVKRNMQS